MSVNYLTTILFTKSELTEITNITEGIKDIAWEDYNVVNKTVNCLRFLNCIEAKNSKLSANNKNIRIFVYTNLRDEIGHLCSLVSYVNKQLRSEITLDGNLTTDASGNTIEEANVLQNLGVYKDQKDIGIWINQTQILSTNNSKNQDPITIIDDVTSVTDFNSYSRQQSILFLTNRTYQKNGRVVEKKNTLHPSGPQLANRSKTKFVNRNKLIFRLLKNLTANSGINKVIYLDNSYLLPFEGFHNYLSTLLDKFAFITSPAVHGDRLEHSDLIDGLSNNIIGYNSALFSDTSSGLSSLVENDIFDDIINRCKSFTMGSNINGDTTSLRKAMTRIYYYMFNKKLTNFNFFFTLPSSLFLDKDIFLSLNQNNTTIMSQKDIVDTEDNNINTGKCLFRTTEVGLDDTLEASPFNIDKLLIKSVNNHF